MLKSNGAVSFKLLNMFHQNHAFLHQSLELGIGGVEDLILVAVIEATPRQQRRDRTGSREG